MAPGDPHSFSSWLRAALAALLLAAPTMSARLPAEAEPVARESVAQEVHHALTMTRFSELTELTPANVAGLLPLVGHGAPLLASGSQPEDPQLAIAGAGRASRPFLAEQAEAVELMSQEHPRAHARAPRVAVSYLLGSALATAPGGVAAAAARELRAWDPIDRQVLWSVHEALPISPAALVTAGGLVLYGTDDGWLKALDARTGRVLWSHRVAGRRLDEPRSFRGADGHQYIAVRALPHSSSGGGETLLFALPH